MTPHASFLRKRRNILLYKPSKKDKKLVLAAFLKAEKKGLTLVECYEAGINAWMGRNLGYSKEEAAAISTDVLLARRWKSIVTREEE
jgi:hypothetical protein